MIAVIVLTVMITKSSCGEGDDPTFSDITNLDIEG